MLPWPVDFVDAQANAERRGSWQNVNFLFTLQKTQRDWIVANEHLGPILSP